MNRNYFFVIVAASILSLCIVVFSMWQKPQALAVQSDISPPTHSPFASSISAIGVIEAKSGNILIGSDINRVVNKVFVQVGVNVKKGEALLEFENTDLKTNLMVAKFAYDNAQAQLQKLKAMPRAEDLVIADASYKRVQVELDLAKEEYERVVGLEKTQAISKEQISKRYFNYLLAEAACQGAHAELEKVKLGTWQKDLDIAGIEVEQAKARVASAEAEIARTILYSPMNGTVLQINVHTGELPPLDSSRNPIMVIGDMSDLHLRVNINQYEVANFDPNAPAVAFVQGNSKEEIPLDFVKIEPFLVNKQNLSNDIMDKVDTRVLPVIYRLKTDNQFLYVGQQLDVFIKKHELQKAENA
ncbi:MAG: hypothetical protein P4L16_07310 [Chlamydiales bacterium]|nr:hypothetical protein [Chlamydiales bacterium]